MGSSRFGGDSIGLALTLIILASIPVTNASVNPARSTGPALFVGGWALEQLWLFWLAPIVGGVLGGLVFRGLISGVAKAAGSLQVTEADPGLKRGAHEIDAPAEALRREVSGLSRR